MPTVGGLTGPRGSCDPPPGPAPSASASRRVEGVRIRVGGNSSVRGFHARMSNKFLLENFKEDFNFSDRSSNFQEDHRTSDCYRSRSGTVVQLGQHRQCTEPPMPGHSRQQPPAAPAAVGAGPAPGRPAGRLHMQLAEIVPPAGKEGRKEESLGV